MPSFLGSRQGYNVICVNCGSIFLAPEGSELEIRAKKREEKGFLDALPIQPKECDYCLEEAKLQDERTERLLSV